MDSEESKGIKILGKNIAEIPCFRDSYFYGMCTGIFGGFSYFMWTSKVKMASHVAVGTFAVSTMAYWTYCRIKYTEEEKTTLLVKQLIKGQKEDSTNVNQ